MIKSAREFRFCRHVATREAITSHVLAPLAVRFPQESLRLVTTRGNCLADRLFGGFDAIVQEECEKRILADELSG